MGLFNKTIVYHKDPSYPMINIRNEKLAKNKILTKLLSFFFTSIGKKIMYCHNIYALNHGVSMIDCFDDHHWDHIRKSNNAYFLHENTSEGFSPQRIANELKQVVELKNNFVRNLYHTI